MQTHNISCLPSLSAALLAGGGVLILCCRCISSPLAIFFTSVWSGEPPLFPLFLSVYFLHPLSLSLPHTPFLLTSWISHLPPCFEVVIQKRKETYSSNIVRVLCLSFRKCFVLVLASLEYLHLSLIPAYQAQVLIWRNNTKRGLLASSEDFLWAPLTNREQSTSNIWPLMGDQLQWSRETETESTRGYYATAELCHNIFGTIGFLSLSSIIYDIDVLPRMCVLVHGHFFIIYIAGQFRITIINIILMIKI